MFINASIKLACIRAIVNPLFGGERSEVELMKIKNGYVHPAL
jgi:hypothetical protein